MEFCSPFDEALAQQGPAAIFLPDPEGALRFDATWTRDCWGRSPGPHAHAWAWTLYRDKRSGFVGLLLVTSPTLLVEHPRLELRQFDSREAAVAAQAAFGQPAVSATPWS